MRKLTLIKRSAPRCGSCEMMQAALEGEGIPHDIIDITTEPDAIEAYNLTGVPVLLIEDDAGEHIRLTGFQPVEHIADLLKGDE